MRKFKQDNLADAYDAAVEAHIAAYKAVFDPSFVKEKSVDVDRNDPSTWRRPNLDNLKASILSDWNAVAA